MLFNAVSEQTKVNKEGELIEIPFSPGQLLSAQLGDAHERACDQTGLTTADRGKMDFY